MKLLTFFNTDFFENILSLSLGRLVETNGGLSSPDALEALLIMSRDTRCIFDTALYVITAAPLNENPFL